jgi:hypothetical protein
MRKSMNWSAVSQWQRLTAEWDAVSAEYESLKTRVEDPGLDDVQRTTLLTAAEHALTRLREVKASMDDLVSKGAAERPAPDGQFTVATLDPADNMDEASSDAKRRLP